MAATHVINVDLAKVWETSDGAKGRKFLRTLAWGDFVELAKPIGEGDEFIEIRTHKFEVEDGASKPVPVTGFIRPPAKGGRSLKDVVVPIGQSRVLKVNFVDVQQGDGSVVETPKGKVMLIDGGDNQLFARYLAGRFRGTTKEAPQPIDCVLITHGDADHFRGLTRIIESEEHRKAWKKLFIRPRRVFHNGLVKRPEKRGDGGKRAEKELLGQTETLDGREVITGLVDDLLKVDDGEMNEPFLRWKRALQEYEKRYAGPHGPIEFRRLSAGDDAAFDFLKDEGVTVEVLGPLLTKAPSGKMGLKFLGEPPDEPRIGHDPKKPRRRTFPGHSASHTINGHSVIIRLSYGRFRFLFAGDLNEEAEAALVEDESLRLKLRAEVLKVPHHGSADFSTGFLEAVCPMVSLISSGDENAQKEYIHPRASLVGALGRFSRIPEPLIFVTELVAFFNVIGYVDPERHELKEGAVVMKDGKVVELKDVLKRFFAFSRTNFGLVKIRTDGRRLLVYTDSGNVKLKEAYAYEFPDDSAAEPTPAAVTQA